MKRSILGLLMILACDAKDETKSADAKSTEAKSAEAKSADAKAPDAKAAETKTPETKTPETKAPETKAPETKAPETKAPETKAPTPATPTPATPTAPTSDVLAAIDASSVVHMSSDEPARAWKLQSKNVYARVDDPSELVRFLAHPFEREGKKYVLAMWSFQADTAEVHAALFVGKPGAWSRAWVKPRFAEHSDSADEVLPLPPVLQIGPERWAVLHVVYAGPLCGDDSCKPEDDYVDNLLFEITPTGPTSIWTLKAPGCELKATADAGDLSPEKCLVGVEPGANAEVHDLVVELTSRNKRKAKTVRFVYDADRYGPKK